jgi:hypothetical protein
LILGKKGRQLGGAGNKLKYVEPASKLLAWYREHQTHIDSNSPITTTNIPRERVTLKQLSSKWYDRFMKRHRLSVQRPKRKQKVPLVNAYLRRASKWREKLGPVGAFTPNDVCNMDESPLELFGDQAKRSVNDIGTANYVEGHKGCFISFNPLFVSFLSLLYSTMKKILNISFLTS